MLSVTNRHILAYMEICSSVYEVEVKTWPLEGFDGFRPRSRLGLAFIWTQYYLGLDPIKTGS